MKPAFRFKAVGKKTFILLYLDGKTDIASGSTYRVVASTNHCILITLKKVNSYRPTGSPGVSVFWPPEGLVVIVIKQTTGAYNLTGHGHPSKD